VNPEALIAAAAVICFGIVISGVAFGSAVGDGIVASKAVESIARQPEARPNIFSLFYTTKPEGSGVGLAMTFRILQLHNASIDFSSEVNQGTTFRVSLPC